MNSWQTLLLIQMVQGRYLASKPPDEHDWVVLWGLVIDMDEQLLERLGIAALATMWKQG